MDDTVSPPEATVAAILLSVLDLLALGMSLVDRDGRLLFRRSSPIADEMPVRSSPLSTASRYSFMSLGSVPSIPKTVYGDVEPRSTLFRNRFQSMKY
ncbi:hypothetical protein CPB85DRAFT_1327186 [Mucidula mucida]|nr:hypothetical protein CPB85DRAFT_1327186 [Mucidula mucida]